MIMNMTATKLEDINRIGKIVNFVNWEDITQGGIYCIPKIGSVKRALIKIVAKSTYFASYTEYPFDTASLSYLYPSQSKAKCLIPYKMPK